MIDHERCFAALKDEAGIQSILISADFKFDTAFAAAAGNEMAIGESIELYDRLPRTVNWKLNVVIRVSPLRTNALEMSNFFRSRRRFLDTPDYLQTLSGGRVHSFL